MEFKVGDKVVFSKSINLPRWVKALKAKNISGIVLRKCPIVSSCSIVRLSNGREEHLYNSWIWIVKVKVKNQQLLFNFME